MTEAEVLKRRLHLVMDNHRIIESLRVNERNELLRFLLLLKA